MKKRLIYSIGSTASHAINRFREITDFNPNDFTYKAWDTQQNLNLSNFKDKEFLFLDNSDLYNTLKNLNEDKKRGSLESNGFYERLSKVVPMNDLSFIESLNLDGMGSSMTPILSSLVAELNRAEIGKTIRNDLRATEDENPNVILITSPCGGTSAGLSSVILSELAQYNCNVFLFYITPNYFVNVNQPEPDLVPKVKANTVATLFKTLYELQNHKMVHSPYNDRFQARITPFIIESQYNNLRSVETSELTGDPIKENTDTNIFNDYIADCINLFLVDENRFGTNSWIASQNNSKGMLNSKRDILPINVIFANNKINDISGLIYEVYNHLVKNSIKEDGARIMNMLLKGKNYSASLIGNNPELILNALKKYKTNSIEFDIYPKDFITALERLQTDILSQYKDKIDNKEISKKNEDISSDNNLAKKLEENEGGSKESISFWKNIINLFPKNNFSKNNEDDNDEDYDDTMDETIKTVSLTEDKIQKIENIQDFVEKAILSYEKNCEYLIGSIKEITSTGIAINGNSEIKIEETILNHLVKDLFVSPEEFEQEIESMFNNSIKSTSIDKLPIFGTHKVSSHRTYLRPYNAIHISNNTPYQLNIFSFVPYFYLKYLNNDYIQDYENLSNRLEWIYPDKRFINDQENELCQDYKKWLEEKFKKLDIYSDDEINNKEDTFKTELIAYGLILDAIKEDGFAPVFELNCQKQIGNINHREKVVVDKLDECKNILFFLRDYSDFNSTPRNGRNLEDVADQFIEDVIEYNNIHNSSIFNEENAKISIENLLVSAKKQILGINEKKLRDILVQEETEIKTWLDGIRDEYESGELNREDLQKHKIFSNFILKVFKDIYNRAVLQETKKYKEQGGKAIHLTS